MSDSGTYYDVTATFWSMVSYCIMMAHERLLTTKIYNDYKMMASSKNGFKMHVSVLEEVSPVRFLVDLPKGVRLTNDKYLIFDDVNCLFYGIQEMYRYELPCRRQQWINSVVSLIENAISVEEAANLTNMFSNSFSIN